MTTLNSNLRNLKRQLKKQGVKNWDLQATLEEVGMKIAARGECSEVEMDRNDDRELVFIKVHYYKNGNFRIEKD